MAKKKVKSDIQIQYEKQLKRVQQFIRRAEKRGYTFPKNIIPQKLQRPTKKSVEKISAMTPEYFYSKAKFTKPNTGEIVKGSEGRKYERRHSAEKAAETRFFKRTGIEKAVAKEIKRQEDAKKRQEKAKIKQEKREAKRRKNKTVSTTSEARYDEFDASDIEDKVIKYNQIQIEIKRLKEVVKNLREVGESRGYLFKKGYLDKIDDFIDEASRAADNIGSPIYDQILLELETITEEAILSSQEVIFKDPWTGTAFKGYEGVKIEKHREQIAKEYEQNFDTPVNETTLVLDMIREYIKNWAPSNLWSDWFTDVKGKDKNILERILNGAITNDGEDAVAQRCQEHATELLEIVESVLYNSGGKKGRDTITFDLVRFSAIVMGRSLTQYESEELTNLSEMSEVE